VRAWGSGAPRPYKAAAEPEAGRALDDAAAHG
jgi:hypothetical protein